MDVFLIYCLVICVDVLCLQCRFLKGSSFDSSYTFSISLINDRHLICMHALVYLTGCTPLVSAVLSSYRQCYIVCYTLLQQMPWALHLHVVCC